ncbi:MAG: ribosome recycling factor [Candidatus Hydrogenedentes bacterium]|jgi:ribosome recycling factor|nr:ribosome recycling factor [Candidatus Hydrogenedentota bacterium]
MSHPILAEATEKMDKSVTAFQAEIASIRTGRANASILDPVEVEAYGSRMKINQLGTITVPDSHLIVIDLWDKSQMSAVERAIMSSSLDLMPSNDGQVIRIPIPQLNEQRRRDLVKLAGKYVEEAKVACRSIRRHAIDTLKKMQKDGEVPEDDAHRLTEAVQKLTDMHTDKIDAIYKAKEADIMEV